jgi:hypothetical protein
MPTATHGRYRVVGESSQNLAIPFISPALIFLSLTPIFPYFPLSQSDPYFSPSGPVGRFPDFIGTTSRSDFRRLLRQRSFSVALALPPCARCSLPSPPSTAARAGGSLAGLPVPGSCGGKRRTSQVPGEPCCVRALLCDPGGMVMAKSLRPTPCCLPSSPKRRLPRCGHLGAPSHGPHTRCLRFAAPVTRTPRKTRYRLLTRRCRAGFAPAELHAQFPAGLPDRPSHAPRLRLAHKDLTPAFRDPGFPHGLS